MNYKCSICSREYCLQNQYNKHFAWCNWLHTSSKEHRQSNDSIEKKFTDFERDQLIRELIYTTEDLKREVKTLKTKLYNVESNKRMKTNDWLDTNVQPECTYSEWITHIDVTELDVLYLLQYGLLAGVERVLNAKLVSNEILPIYTCQHEKNTLYEYDKNVKNGVNSWKHLDKKDFTKLITKIVFKIQQFYLQWRLQQPKEALVDDKQNTAKIMQPIEYSVSSHNKLYANVCESICKDIDNDNGKN
jgi:hypothetical protein